MIPRAVVTAALLVTVSAVQAQEAGGFNDDLQTGLDQITIQPLDDDDTFGFGTGGLTLEDLQNLPNGGFLDELRDITTEIQENVTSASGGTLRALDKLTGEVADLNLAVGETQTFGRIDVILGDCRYPDDNPSGNAYAYVTVRLHDTQEAAFAGWMVAASPALNAMDHQRYDLWPLTCQLPESLAQE
ncbi:DUF2155 domain-containing protein [Celeribacter litoreus]|uniref:DUF2155 domain-containing protein n=1 Tax=Celeribacter litoreus TaxID=2876714 RepID=UPI001CCF786C|nr:DUF2155 domain-containing protein [Celeribacter litoreus]MCA0043288.1 DUF2155 domain-containing protein [Celeribacter litoreus]